MFGLGYSVDLRGWRGPFHGVGCENEGRLEAPEQAQGRTWSVEQAGLD